MQQSLMGKIVIVDPSSKNSQIGTIVAVTERVIRTQKSYDKSNEFTQESIPILWVEDREGYIGNYSIERCKIRADA